MSHTKREDKKLFSRSITVILAALFVSSLAACGGQSGGQGDGGQEGSGGGPVKAVATYSILGDIVENVGGEEIELTTLVGPNGDAHTFEPAPSDSAEISEAAVVFENGLEFETWLDELYESSGSEAERVVVSEGMDLLPIAEEGEHAEEGGEEHADEEEHEEEGEHAGEEEDEHGEFDPHVWHDVSQSMVMVETVRDALVEVDPDNAEAYRANAKEYLSELEELDAEVTERAESVPEENRVLFTSHDTFGYFAERYGFEVDTALASVSTEASDPSAGETAALIREIEASGVPAIFAENISNSDLMSRVASEAGVDLAPTLYTDALGKPDSEGGTYVKMMRYNTSTIADALSG